MWLLALLFACADPRPADLAPPDLRVCDASARPLVAVLTEITFARADEGGVSDGFDLDGAVSTVGGPTGCGVGDYVAPDGTEGIDNAFSPIVGVLETTEAQAVEPLIQSTINSGELLLFLELEDVDDPVEDACVHLTLLRGSGEPVVGNERIVAHQTFERDDGTFASRVEDVAIVGGSVIAGPLTLELPITVFALDLRFVLEDARIRVDLREDGTFGGVIAGGVVIEEILAIAEEENVDDSVAELLDGVLGLAADLAPDERGACTQISVTLAFEAVGAFFFED